MSRRALDMLALSSDMVDALLLDELGWKMRVSTLRVLRAALCILSVLGGGIAFIAVALFIGPHYGSALEYGGRPPILMLAVLVELYAALVPILGLTTGSERDWLTRGSHVPLCRTLDISQSSMVIARMLPRTIRGFMTSLAICSAAAALLTAWGVATPARLGSLLLLPALSSSLPVALAFKIACDGDSRTRITGGYALASIAIPACLGVTTAAVVLAFASGAVAIPARVGTFLLSAQFELAFFLVCLLGTGAALVGLIRYCSLLDGAGFRIVPAASRPDDSQRRNLRSSLYPMKALVCSPSACKLVKMFGICLGAASFLKIAVGPLLPIAQGNPFAEGIIARAAVAFCYVCLMYSLGIAVGVSRAIGSVSLLAAWRALWEWGGSVRGLVLPALATWTLVQVVLVSPLVAAGPLFGIHPAHVAVIGLATMMGNAFAEATLGQRRTSSEVALQVMDERGASVAVLSLFLSVAALLASLWYMPAALAICIGLYGGTLLCLHRRIRFRQLDLSV